MLWLVGALAIHYAQSATSCMDVTAKGYFSSKVYHDGLPPSSNGRTYVTIPAQLSYCELEELSQYCIDRINQYRAGTLRFSDNTVDPGIPKPAMAYAKGYSSCSSSQAFGDMSGSSGGCANAHANAGACRSASQNSCCFRSGLTSAQIRSQLNGCLQQMWDEGIGLADNAGFTMANGHWYNMRSTGNRYGSCGFAYDSNGGLWMNQDFVGSAPAEMTTCSCDSQYAGSPDGCGGTCVNADGSKLGRGEAGIGPFGISAVVLSLITVIVLIALLVMILKKKSSEKTRVDAMKGGQFIAFALYFVVFVLSIAAVASPVWAAANGVTLSLWEVCVPSPTGTSCSPASTASSGGQGVFMAVQAFAVLGMLASFFVLVGAALTIPLKQMILKKLVLGCAVFACVSFFLALCLFGGYYLDEAGALSAQWGCGIEILCFFLSLISIPFARSPTVG